MYISRIVNFTAPKKKKPTRVAAASPGVSLGRRTIHARTEQRWPQGSKRCETKVTMVCDNLSYCCSRAQHTHDNWF